MGIAPSVKSARRVVEVFEYFARRRAPATLTDISSALNYPASSTFALLNTLRDLGYLDYAREDRTFVPTLRAALLGIWVNDALLADDNVIRLMYRLRDETGGSATLGVQSGERVQYIHVARGEDAASHGDVVTGAVRPLLRSAMGTVLLSLKSRAELRALMARINAQDDATQAARAVDVNRRIEDYRRDGYAYSEGVSTAGSGIVAMLLAAPRHQPAMVIGLGARLSVLRSQRERFVDALRELVDAHRQRMEEGLPDTFAMPEGGRAR